MSQHLDKDSTEVAAARQEPESGGDPSRRMFLRGAVVAVAAAPVAALIAAPPRGIGPRMPAGGALQQRTASGLQQGPQHGPDPLNTSHHNGSQDLREVGRNFRDIQSHENAHVAFLLSVLGAKARPKPTFQLLNQPNIGKFVRVSQSLENTGTGTYLGAAPAILDKTVLSAAGSIAFIEARHAGWLNSLVRAPITQNVFGQPQSFERALTVNEVVTLASPFVASLNGGPPLTYSTTPSADNDIAILNFALALEFLEQEFYNINVPKFFK